MSKVSKTSAYESLLPSNNFALIKGCLISDDGNPISYWPLEVSQFTLVIVTDQMLMIGDAVYLSHGPEKIPLSLTKSVANYNESVFFLCCFTSQNKSKNLEEILKQSPELRRWNAEGLHTDPLRLPNGQIFVRAARFQPSKPLQLIAKTFGMPSKYDFSIENASKSGILMSEISEPAPFKVNTLLEIVIDPERALFSEPLSCLAKVVRVISAAASPYGKNSFAVRMLENELAFCRVWATYVDELEQDIFKDR